MKSRTLLLPLLLTGCQMHATPDSDAPPAQQTVDALFQTSLTSITQAQRELAQSAGVRFDPVVPVAPPRPVALSGPAAVATPATKTSPAAVSLPLPSPPRHIAGLAYLHYTGTPETLPPLVSHGGKRQNLDTAVKAIVPAGWTTVLSADIRQHFTTKVSWQNGDQWPHTLDKLAGEYHLTITVMWASKQVTVALPMAGAAAVTTTKSVSTPLLSQAKTAAAPQQTPAKAPTPAPAKTPVPEKSSPAPATVWKADTGQTLKDVLFVWSAAADCHGKHWTVDWVTETNYRIDAPLQFTGDYKEALNSIFGLYMNANVPLYAGTSTPQCLLKVDDKPVR